MGILRRQQGELLLLPYVSMPSVRHYKPAPHFKERAVSTQVHMLVWSNCETSAAVWSKTHLSCASLCLARSLMESSSLSIRLCCISS